MTLALRIARLTCVSDSRINLLSTSQAIRQFSSETQPPTKSKNNTKLSREAVRENVKGYMFSRFFDYVKNYDKVLEKNFPSAMRVYRTFFDGLKEFFADMKQYLKISRIANSSNGPRALNRKELELYLQMPRDMIKVAPTILFSSLPMVGYAVFPLVYMYPRKFLTSHFWTLQQKSEFKQIAFVERLRCQRPVFRCLQAKVHCPKCSEQEKLFVKILGLLGSGFHPTTDQILAVKDVFAHPPYDFNSLSSTHIKMLANLHGVPGALFRSHRLAEHAYVIHFMDLAIMREGGVHNMPQDAIRNACYLRGLNPVNLSNDERIAWLQNWVKISQTLKEEHLSMFLHLPIFMAYNHPNNWQLIYKKR